MAEQRLKIDLDVSSSLRSLQALDNKFGSTITAGRTFQQNFNDIASKVHKTASEKLNGVTVNLKFNVVGVQKLSGLATIAQNFNRVTQAVHGFTNIKRGTKVVQGSKTVQDAFKKISDGYKELVKADKSIKQDIKPVQLQNIKVLQDNVDSYVQVFDNLLPKVQRMIELTNRLKGVRNNLGQFFRSFKGFFDTQQHYTYKQTGQHAIPGTQEVLQNGAKRYKVTKEITEQSVKKPPEIEHFEKLTELVHTFDTSVSEMQSKARSLQQSINSVTNSVTSSLSGLEEFTKKTSGKGFNPQLKAALRYVTAGIDYAKDIVTQYQKLANQLIRIPDLISTMSQMVSDAGEWKTVQKQISTPTFLDPNHTSKALSTEWVQGDNPFIVFFRKYAKFCKALAKQTQGTRIYEVTSDFRKTADSIFDFYKNFSQVFRATINNTSQSITGFQALQKISQAFQQLEGGAKSFNLIGAGMANLGKGMQAIDSVKDFKFTKDFADQIRQFVENVVPVKDVLQTYLVKGSGDQGSIEPHVVQQKLVPIVNLFVGMSEGIVKISQAMQGLRDVGKHIPTKKQIDSFIQKIRAIGGLGRLVNVPQNLGLGNTQVKAYHADADFRGFIQVAKYFSTFSRGVSQLVSTVQSIFTYIDSLLQKTKTFDQDSVVYADRAKELWNYISSVAQVVSEIVNRVTSSVGSLAQIKNFAGQGELPDFKVMSGKMQGFFLIADHISKLASGFGKLDELSKNLALQNLKSPDSSVNRIAHAINTLTTLISGTGDLAGLQKTTQTDAETGKIITKFEVIDANVKGFILIANTMSKFGNGLTRLQNMSKDLLEKYGDDEQSYKSVASAVALATTIVQKIGEQLQRKNKLKPIDDRHFKIVDNSENFKIFQTLSTKMSQLSTALPRLQKTSDDLTATYGADNSKFINSVVNALLLVDDIIQEVSDMFSEKRNDPKLGEILEVQDRVKVFGTIAKNLSTFSNSLNGLRKSSDELVKQFGGNSSNYIQTVAPGLLLVDDITTQIFKMFTETRTDDKGNKYVDFQNRVDAFKQISTILLNFKNSLTGLTQLSKQIQKELNDNSEITDVIDVVAKALKLSENIIDAVGVRGVRAEGSRKIADGTVNGFNTIATALLNFKQGLYGLKKLSDGLDTQIIDQIVTKVEQFTSKLVKVFGTLGSKKLSKIKSTGGRFKIIEQFENADFGSFANIADKVNRFANGLKGLVDSIKVIGSDSSGNVEKLSSTIGGLISTLSKAAKTDDFVYFQRLAHSVYMLRQSSTGLITSSQKVKTAVERMGVAAKKSWFSFDKLNPIVRQFFTAVAGYNVIYSIERGIQSAVKAMFELQYAMTRINTITRQSQTVLNKWTYDVMRLSSEFGVVKKDITKALYEINSATIVGADAMTVLNASVRAARAGYTDTTKVAELLAKVINAYGYSAKDATYLSDVLFKTVEVGINTMEQLSQYMGRVVTVAANAGVAFEEISASIATMTSRGLNTNIAVTALNSAILKLSQGGQNLNPIFRQMGYASSAAALQTQGLAGALRVLYNQTHGNTQALTKLGFNYRDIRAVSILASEAIDVFDDHLKSMYQASGQTQQALSKVADTLQYKWQRLKSTVSNFFVDFQMWSNTGSVLKPLMDAATSLLNTLREILFSVNENLNTIQLTIKYTAVLYGVVKVNKLLLAGFRKLKTTVSAQLLSARLGNLKWVRSMGMTRAQIARIRQQTMLLRHAANTATLSLFTKFKQLLVLLRSARIGAILFKNAIKGLPGIALAVAEIAAFEAIYYAFTRNTQKALDFSEALTKLQIDGSKAIEQLSTSLSKLLSTPINSSEVPQWIENVKNSISQLDNQIEITQAQLQKLQSKKKTNAQDRFQAKVQLSRLQSVKKATTDILKSHDESVRSYKQQNKQLIRVQANLKSIQQALSNAYKSSTDSASQQVKNLRALGELELLKEYFKQFGVQVEYATANTLLFEQQVKAALNIESVDKMQFNKGLLQLEQTLTRLIKGSSQLKKSFSALSDLQIHIRGLYGIDAQMFNLQRQFGEFEKNRKKIFKGQVVSIPQFGLSDEFVKQLESKLVTSFSDKKASLSSIYQTAIAAYFGELQPYKNMISDIDSGKASDAVDMLAKLPKALQAKVQKLSKHRLLDPKGEGRFKQGGTFKDLSNNEQFNKIKEVLSDYIGNVTPYTKLIQAFKQDPIALGILNSENYKKVRDKESYFLAQYSALFKTEELQKLKKEQKKVHAQGIRNLILQGKYEQAKKLHRQVTGSELQALSAFDLVTNDQILSKVTKQIKAGVSLRDIMAEQIKSTLELAKAQGLSEVETSALVQANVSLVSDANQAAKALYKLDQSILNIVKDQGHLTDFQKAKESTEPWKNRLSELGRMKFGNTTLDKIADEFRKRPDLTQLSSIFKRFGITGGQEAALKKALVQYLPLAAKERQIAQRNAVASQLGFGSTSYSWFTQGMSKLVQAEINSRSVSNSGELMNGIKLGKAMQSVREATTAFEDEMSSLGQYLGINFGANANKYGVAFKTQLLQTVKSNSDLLQGLSKIKKRVDSGENIAQAFRNEDSLTANFWKGISDLSVLMQLQKKQKQENVKVPEAIQAQTAMSVGSSEFIHTLMQQTTKTPQQIALDSINKNVKKITKNVKQSSGNTPAVVII